MTRVVLVHGPPGTGKTSYLSREAARAAAEHGPERVAIVSLTRTAAAEIAGRDVGIPPAQVGTLHAAVYRALGRPPLAEAPEGLRDWNAAHPALRLTGARSLASQLPLDADGDRRTHGDRLHAAVLGHRARRTPQARWAEDERAFHARWRDWCAQTGRWDFTDLIERALDQLPAHPTHPRVLLLDEAQDFSALELALAVRWARAAVVTIVAGDTDQALYQWRGSDPGALLALPRTEERVLARSHRVPVAVHALARRWIGQLDTRSSARYRPTAARGEVRRLPISLRYPEPLLDELDADADAGRSAMVLTACGYMLAPVLRALGRAAQPFHNPHRSTYEAWNPLAAAGPLLAFLRPQRMVWGARARAWTWEDLRGWTDPLVPEALARGARARIAATCRSERRRAAVVAPAQVAELLGGAPGSGPAHAALRGDVEWWASRLRAPSASRLRYALDLLRRRGPAPLAQLAGVLAGDRRAADLPWVTVGTFHSVKGGESDSVYVFPDLSRSAMWEGWQTGGAGREQIVRMLYVALTRARLRVTILDPSRPEHVPMELFDALRTA